MPRAPATSDAFNAIAEPRRRRIIGALADGGGHPVGDLVKALRLPQPVVSKHLGVLRAVGIVSVTKNGRSRMYRLNPRELKPVHDWVKIYEQFWTRQLDRIKEHAERAAKERSTRKNQPPAAKEN